MTSISQFGLAAILLTLTAAFNWVNYRLGLMPRTIGLLVMGLGASLVAIGAEAAVPGLVDYEDLAGFVRQVDFEGKVIHGMLALLLFAAALRVDFAQSAQLGVHYRRNGDGIGRDMCCRPGYLNRAGVELACRNQASATLCGAVLSIPPKSCNDQAVELTLH